MTRAADSSTSQNVQRKEEKKKKKKQRKRRKEKNRRRQEEEGRPIGGQPFWRESNGISTINSSRIRAACARAGLLMHKQEKNKQAFKCSSKV